MGVHGVLVGEVGEVWMGKGVVEQVWMGEVEVEEVWMGEGEFWGGLDG